MGDQYGPREGPAAKYRAALTEQGFRSSGSRLLFHMPVRSMSAGQFDNGPDASVDPRVLVVVGVLPDRVLEREGRL